MREVKVKKAELRDKLQINRDQHRGQYHKAIKGWRLEAMGICSTAIEECAAGTRTAIIVTDAPPQDHTKDYDRVIAMLDMSVDDELVLDEKIFRQYVLDDWQWKEQWVGSNSKYLTD